VPLPRTRQEWADSTVRATRQEADAIGALFDHYGVDVTALMGEGYNGYRFLSKFAVAMVPGMVDIWTAEEGAREAEAKRAIHTAARISILSDDKVHPVYRCPVCRGSRPHTHLGGWEYRCDSCGTREDVSA
jgi:DNA-directed RNA polymerase subunit RPC12/RpoP